MPNGTGRHLDGWGNKITVWAVANPGESDTGDSYRGDGEATLEYLRESAQGYGIIRFHKSTESVTFESWPVYGEFEGVEKHPQHPGFPRTVDIK